MTIELKYEPNFISLKITDKNSNNWQRLAYKMAKKICETKGIAFIDATILVHLPEKGRFFHKDAGYVSFYAYG
jgi:hypothetical protein